MVSLCLGITSSVWAITEPQTIFSQNFEDCGGVVPFSNYFNGKNGYTAKWQLKTANSNTYLEAWSNVNGGRNGALNFGLSNSSYSDNWTLSFDCSISPCADGLQQMAVAGSENCPNNNTTITNKAYLILTNTENGGTSYNVTIGGTTLAEPVTLTKGKFYKYKLQISNANTASASLKVLIKDGETIILDATETVNPTEIGYLYGFRDFNGKSSGTEQFDNIVMTQEVEAGYVAAPIFSVKGVNGISRTISLASETTNATFKWSETAPAQDEDFSTWTATTETVTTSAATIYAVAIKGSNVSEVSTIETGAGVGIKLNTPTYVKGAYNSATQETAITLNATQSVLLNPVASVVYSIDGGAETTVASGTVVNVPNDATLTWYATSTGYTNSDKNEIVVKAPAITGLVNAWSSVDYVAIATEDKGGITTNVLAQNVNGKDYFQLVSATAGALDADKVSVRPCDNGWLLRNGNRGLYNSNATGFAIANLHAGDVVVFDGAYGNGAFSMSNGVNSVVSAWDSTDGVQYVYNITADGTATFEIARYAFVKRIRIYTAPTTPVTISDAGYATFVTPYAVDFTDNAIEAYAVSAVNANTVTLTKVTQVPAGEAVIVKGESGNVNVIASAEPITNLMKAATTDIACDADATTINYVLANGANGVGLYPVTSGTIAAGKGYLPVPNSVAVKGGFTFVTDDVTAANVVKAAPAAVKNGKFATAEGIVIVKDGVKYNVAGMKK